MLWIAFKLVSLQCTNNSSNLQGLHAWLWIAFKLVSLQCTNNRSGRASLRFALWIAFKLVSLQCTNNKVCRCSRRLHVVNCFQISIFAVHEQLATIGGFIATELWIAFKLVSLQCTNNLNALSYSIYALWIAFKLVSLQCTNNVEVHSIDTRHVVNCFQISIFAVHEQPLSLLFSIRLCCELLSN